MEPGSDQVVIDLSITRRHLRGSLAGIVASASRKQRTDRYWA